MNMQPLNLCRSLVKQCSEMLLSPSLTDLQRAELSHPIYLCQASQKFILPNGGVVINDIELRALDETQQLRLPHSFIALEYIASEASYHGKWQAKRILFAGEIDSVIMFTSAFCSNANGRWFINKTHIIDKNNYIDRSRTGANGAPVVKIQYPNGRRDVGIFEEFCILLGVINALQCTNVHIERSEPKKKSGKKIKAALPFDEYHILTIDVPGRTSDGTGIGGPHRSPREHLRRGHIRRLSDGKRIWVNATVVAAGRGGGKVKKDYALRANVPEQGEVSA